uniref:ATP synthase F0 subunit 8 n=1 Tax=Sternoptyx obscura TaxID=81875 RepID=UPI0028FC81B9|nr:ATP synthase F0 subunit 8 [Sternoptyx obscura]WNG77901.1 ATP synthase F0 subunit 8 [Sternoptyx obscura]WNH23158.1 ATP synthase F0 subunit 8 [Sternoptyx obscura]
MPQLDPAPWLSILLFTWLVFMAIIPSKVLGHEFPNEPTLNTEKVKTKSWNWPWH